MVAIPAVDLAAAAAGSPAERARLLDSCRRYGLVRVVGHGVSPELREKARRAMAELFELPEEVRRKNEHVIPGSGYLPLTPANPLYEALGIYDSSDAAAVAEFFDQLAVVDGHLRETIGEYAKAMHELTAAVAALLAGELGVEGCAFAADWVSLLRMNKYNFTGDTIGSSGLQVHTDGGFITTVEEGDSVGGLEMLDDATGEYVGVDPLPGSFLVVIGDVAKAWSNGILHNVKHRVVCKMPATRVAAASFLLSPRTDVVETPAALVDEACPRVYRAFSYREYRDLRFTTRLRDGAALDLLKA